MRVDETSYASVPLHPHGAPPVTSCCATTAYGRVTVEGRPLLAVVLFAWVKERTQDDGLRELPRSFGGAGTSWPSTGVRAEGC